MSRDRSSWEGRVAEILPERRGHFVFESGHHGEIWLDLERLFLRPHRIRPLAQVLAERIRPVRADVICGPLVEGAFVGLMVASVLDLPFTYSEPTRKVSNDGLFPIDYPIPAALRAELPGKRVAVVNDVINAGSAIRGTLASLEACGADPVAIGTLATHGDAARLLASTHQVALETLASFPSRIWEPAECLLCERGVPIDS